MFLKLNDIEFSCVGTECFADLVSRLPDDGKDVLGISIAGRTRDLASPVEEYVCARTLTYADEEGRRIYERSLVMLFLAVCARLLPGQRVRVRHSFGGALFIDLPGIEESEALADHIAAAMRQMVERDVPFVRTEVSLEEAQEWFRTHSVPDRSHLMRYHRKNTIPFYDLDGYRDYFYGRMVPSTGSLKVFALKPYADGLLLAQPDPADPSRPAPFVDRPKLMRTYGETAEWNRILNVQNVADLNDLAREHKLREFIRVNEALQEFKIQQIAQKFIQSGARLLLIAGPSSSGKTTFSHRLSIALRVYGLRPVKVSLDDYYIDRDKLPREADGSIDLERIEALDLDLINQQLPRLLAGETVDLPEFDFKAQKRAERTHPFAVEPGQPIIIEGIHGLNDRLTASVPADQKFKVYISALTMLNLDDHNRIRTTDARLLRRIVRDYQFRGTAPEETMAMWGSVRHGEDNYIFPYQESADATFNSSLVYELIAMKKYAYSRLTAIRQDNPQYTLAGRLVQFLNYIPDVNVEDEIPVNSILREFIGGCCFYQEED